MTRARNQLWLVEGVKELTIPIVEVFQSRVEGPLVEIVSPTDRDVRNPAPMLFNICLINKTFRWRLRSRSFVKEDLLIVSNGSEGEMSSLKKRISKVLAIPHFFVQ